MSQNKFFLLEVVLLCNISTPSPTHYYVFLILVLLVDIKWCLIVISTCIFLRANDFKHFFLCFLAISIVTKNYLGKKSRCERALFLKEQLVRPIIPVTQEEEIGES
jgi:hypothetical protein